VPDRLPARHGTVAYSRLASQAGPPTASCRPAIEFPWRRRTQQGRGAHLGRSPTGPMISIRSTRPRVKNRDRTSGLGPYHNGPRPSDSTGARLSSQRGGHHARHCSSPRRYRRSLPAASARAFNKADARGDRSLRLGDDFRMAPQRRRLAGRPRAEGPRPISSPTSPTKSQAHREGGVTRKPASIAPATNCSARSRVTRHRRRGQSPFDRYGIDLYEVKDGKISLKDSYLEGRLSPDRKKGCCHADWSSKDCSARRPSRPRPWAFRPWSMPSP